MYAATAIFVFIIAVLTLSLMVALLLFREREEHPSFVPGFDPVKPDVEPTEELELYGLFWNDRVKGAKKLVIGTWKPTDKDIVGRRIHVQLSPGGSKDPAVVGQFTSYSGIVEAADPTFKLLTMRDSDVPNSMRNRAWVTDYAKGSVSVF